MDAKALAKSKRAHSQRHSKKFHPNQISKASTVGTGSSSGKKLPEKQHVRERTPPSLPSNWEQYKEEYDVDIEEPSQEGTHRATDVILPKSKGADYAHLISEAKSQSQTNFSLEGFPLFDDVLDDLNQGFGSLLSAKGQSILSWVEADNFVMEDKATASHEAPFLSLNLHNLAEQLAKADLSQRLFMEADLLPPELCNEALQSCGKQETGQGQTTSEAEVVKNDSGILASYDLSEGEKNVDKYYEVVASERNMGSSSHLMPVFAIRESKSINQGKDEFSISLRTDESTSTGPSVHAVGNQRKKPSQFQAEAVEAELDRLLDSFSETSFPASHSMGNSSHSYASHEKISTLLVQRSASIRLVDTRPSEKGPGLSTSTMLTDNLDETIDDLLKETSHMISPSGVSQPHEVKPESHDTISASSVHPVLKSKLQDDFDSWLDTI